MIFQNNGNIQNCVSGAKKKGKFAAWFQDCPLHSLDKRGGPAAFCLDNLVHLREFYCVCCGGSRWVWVSWFSSQPCRCLMWLTLARGVGIHLTYLLDKQIRPVHFFLDSQTQEVPTIQSPSCAQGLAETPSTSKEQAILLRKKRKDPAWRQDGLTGQANAYKV